MPRRTRDSRTKTCTRCGRVITWRRKWQNCWDQVRYCSAACRKRGLTTTDRVVERTILALLELRDSTATICPGEVAREIGGGDALKGRFLMEQVREASRRLVASGEIEITQGGRRVDPSTAKGAIRLRKCK